jgi:hypothetical protein
VSYSVRDRRLQVPDSLALRAHSAPALPVRRLAGVVDDPEDEGVIAPLQIKDTEGKPSEVGPSHVSMDLGKACRIETYLGENSVQLIPEREIQVRCLVGVPSLRLQKVPVRR